MSKDKKIKKSILIGSLIILLGGLAVFAYSILYNGGIVLKKTSSIEVMNKLKDMHGKGGKFELTQKDIDELSNLLMPKTEGDVTFKGVNIEILDDELLVEAPITYNGYKKVNLLFSSKGKLGFSNGKIIYAPENFKIGKLRLPIKLVMSQVLKLNNKNVYAEDNLIKIDPNVAPFKIDSFKVKDDKIQGTTSMKSPKTSLESMDNESAQQIDKRLVILKQDIQNAVVFMNIEEKSKATETLISIKDAQGKSVEDKKKVISDSISKIDDVVNKTTDSDKKQEQPKSEKDSLAKAQEDLSDAYDQVETSKEQKVISKMQSAVSKMEDNPSYDATKDKAAVKSSYNTLDAVSQERVKIALFTNVDQENLGQLRQVFGL